MKVSVIIPVYNAATTMRASLDSVAAQSFRDFEVVFVDDCSTDDSLKIIENFKQTSALPCNIVQHSVNQGVAAARNTGLGAAKGEYLCFVDADDKIEKYALEKAFPYMEKGVDVIGWDWTLGFEKNGRYIRQADYDTPLQAVKNLMGGTMRGNLWLFLIRRGLVEENGLRFIPGANMGEDMSFTIRAYLNANTVQGIHESLYRYNAVNTASISKQYNETRREEVTRNLADIEKAVAGSKYADELKDYVQYLKLYIKLPLLVDSDKNNYEIWYNWFPEANKYATANKALPFRKRVLQWLASKRMFFGVKLYYVLVYKMVYGIIYR